MNIGDRIHPPGPTYPGSPDLEKKRRPIPQIPLRQRPEKKDEPIPDHSQPGLDIRA
jgi:hypothetical protein